MKVLKSIVMLALVAGASASFANGGVEESKESNYQMSEIGQYYQYKSLAYDHLKAKYTRYAQLFNLCQQKPKAKECGDEYQNATVDYQVAKARYDVFGILLESHNLSAPLPEVAYRDLSEALYELGYLADPKHDDADTLLKAVNHWNHDHGLRPAAVLTLLQLSMVQSTLPINS